MSAPEPLPPDLAAYLCEIGMAETVEGDRDEVGRLPDYLASPPAPCLGCGAAIAPWFDVCSACAGAGECGHASGRVVRWADRAGVVHSACRDCGAALGRSEGAVPARGG